MCPIDVFAHVLLPDFYQAMLQIDATISDSLPFVQHPQLADMGARRQFWDGETRQIIAPVHISPEEYCESRQAAQLCLQANEELMALVRQHRDMFRAGVALVPMSQPDIVEEIIREQVQLSTELVGVQLFTRSCGKSIADPLFAPIFQLCAQAHIPIWLHPVFEVRKPDNNLIFSWEYETSQAMLQLVQAGVLRQYPDLVIITHHAGAMVPYFAERITHMLPEEQAADFAKFYVDTAILGNPKALELAVDYYGVDHVLFGTDAPFGIEPAGATAEIEQAIQQLSLSQDDKEAILWRNATDLLPAIA